MGSKFTRHLIYTVTMAASLLTAGASPATAGTSGPCEPLSVISPAPTPRIPSPTDSPRESLPPQPPRASHTDRCAPDL
jgi:hypothetical protein